MLMLFDAATQAFEYVFPSQPQTGANKDVQTNGIATHEPGAVHVPMGKSQNSPAGQSLSIVQLPGTHAPGAKILTAANAASQELA